MQSNRNSIRRKFLFRFFSGFVLLIIVLFFLIELFAEPYVRQKIETYLTSKSPYRFRIENVNLMLVRSSVDVQGISIVPKNSSNKAGVSGKAASLKLKRIKIFRMLFKSDVTIGEVSISECTLKGSLQFKKSSKSLSVPLNITIGTLSLQITAIEIENIADARKLVLNDGLIKMQHLIIEKDDTLSPANLGEQDIHIQKFRFTTADSNYTLHAIAINYKSTASHLSTDSFNLEPNYPEYQFTGRQRYETDYFRGNFSNIDVYGFSLLEFIDSGNLVCSAGTIGNLNLKAFRDKRKEFKHSYRNTFQEEIYNFPGNLRLDTVEILNGDITYTEHAEDAEKPGFVSFNRIGAVISGITNDTSANIRYLSLEGKALFMGKGRLNVRLVAPLFDKKKSFTVDGILQSMEIDEINTILADNANIYAKGKLDTLRFSFAADSDKAIGKLHMIYHDLDITVRDKSTGDTVGLKPQFLSWIADIKTPDSNPVNGKEVRTGIIEYERDPEKFLFNYVFKSILSGIQYTLTKKSSRKKKS